MTDDKDLINLIFKIQAGYDLNPDEVEKMLEFLGAKDDPKAKEAIMNFGKKVKGEKEKEFLRRLFGLDE